MKLIVHMPADEKNIKELQEKVSLICISKIINYLERLNFEHLYKEKVIDCILNDVI